RSEIRTGSGSDRPGTQHRIGLKRCKDPTHLSLRPVATAPGSDFVFAFWTYSKSLTPSTLKCIPYYDLIQPDLLRASFISYLTAPAIKTNKRMERDDSSRGVFRGLHGLRGYSLVAFQ